MHNWHKIACIALSLSLGLSAQGSDVCDACRTEEYENIAVELYLPEDSGFVEESEVVRYAYMGLDSADESLRSKIQQARNIIISNSSWVADGVKGYIEDRESGTIKELPQFSEVFPSDWEMPVLATNEMYLDD